MTNVTEKSVTNKQIISAYAVLMGFGLVYDQLVDFVEEEMFDDGKTADLVVFGTLITLIPLLPLANYFGGVWQLWPTHVGGLPLALPAAAAKRNGRAGARCLSETSRDRSVTRWPS